MKQAGKLYLLLNDNEVSLKNKNIFCSLECYNIIHSSGWKSEQSISLSPFMVNTFCIKNKAYFYTQMSGGVLNRDGFAY